MSRDIVYRAVYADGGSGISRHYPYVDEEYGDTVEEIRIEDATMEEMLQDLEMEAEGANWHSFMDLYRQIGGIVERVAGKLTATRVIREIYRDGGLLP